MRSRPENLSLVSSWLVSALVGTALVLSVLLQVTNPEGAGLGSSEALGDRLLRDDVPVDAAPGVSDRGPSPALRAHTDMRAFAIRNGVVMDAEEKLVANLRWRDQWALFYVDVHDGDDVVRLYEAVDRNHPEHRFTAMWSATAALPTDWHLVLD